MIQKKKLVQFYLEQYEQAGKKRPKRSISTAEMQKRVQTLFRTLRSAKPGRVNVRLLEDYHRQLKNISVYAHRKNRADILKKLQEEVLPKLVSLDLGILLEEQKEGMDEIFLSWLQENHPEPSARRRCSHCIQNIDSIWYRGRSLSWCPPDRRWNSRRYVRCTGILFCI